MPGLAVGAADATLVWSGRAVAAQFPVEVPPDARARTVLGHLRVDVAGMPAGTLHFQVSLAEAGAPAAPADPMAVRARRYRRAFVSYSSADRAEVLRRVQAFRIAGIEVFQDVLSLDPGERWEHALYREIDRCDVFFLFWSKAAAASPWVGKEIDYALQRKGGRADADSPPDILPVPIEGPPIVPPPLPLGALHFNDELLAHLAVAG
ncbi:MAG TPA: toll/interleukin-1 receptor domain-containing protein [Rubrivivax sp.]|nr:toll/interleukin-1 receptor domain-containing protein [Rubrivivax sp.]